MVQVKKVLALAGSVLLLAAAAACSDDQPANTLAADGIPAPSFNMSGRTPRDVPEVRIDLPPRARAWDNNPSALAQAITDGDGYAVVAFKEPGNARALATGRRGAVTAGTVTAGLQLLRTRGAEVLEVLDAIGGARVRISPQAAADLAGHPLVDFVEPRQYGEVQAQTTPANISLIQAPDFWTAKAATGAGVKIEIIDTGHQQGHPDLPAITNCAGLFGGCNDNATVNWHGTHVLGIITARNNTDGVVGAAPGIAAGDIYMYGACDSAGRCPTDEVTSGISAGIWNVQLMNLSLVQPFDLGQSNAVGQAWSNGILLIAAAGNNMSNTITYPAGYANVIGVSGVLANKTFAAAPSPCGTYSNQGTHVDLAAPIEAYSTIGGSSYGTQCGTSMAAAHVTGAAALVKSKNPTWTNQQIADSLFAWAEDLGTVGKDNLYGHGLVRPARVTAPYVLVSGTTSISTTGNHTWTAVPSGGNGAFTYKWEYRLSGAATWTQVGTGASYTRAITTAQTTFELRLTVTSGGLTASDAHLVSVAFPPVPTITGVTSVTAAGTQTWNATVAGGNGTNAYNWEYRVQGGTWASVGTAASYSRSVTPGNPSFELRVTVTSAGLTGSDTHLVNVAPTTTISGTTSITTAGSHSWTASATGGTGTFTYVWEYRVQGGATWTQVGTASSYTRSVVAGAAAFELRVTVTSGGVSGTDTHLVGVNIPLAPAVTISGDTYLYNGDLGMWTASASGGTGTYTYQWQFRSEISTTWTNVGTGASTYSRVAPIRSFYVRAIVTSGGVSTTSDEFFVYVDYTTSTCDSGGMMIKCPLEPVYQ